MKIGFIGLGKMGGQMVTRILDKGHSVVAFDLNKEAVAAVKEKGATAANDRQTLTDQLEDKIIWLMIPAQFVDAEIETLLPMLSPGSIIIDGGNSDYRLTLKRAEKCSQAGVNFIDVGTSGGILGLKNGFSMMIGGDKKSVDKIEPIIEALSQKGGWHYFGNSGAGHYVKMVHNAIEYGMMEAYAEGYRMLKDGPVKNLDLAAVGEVWRHGSIISSELNDLITEILSENPDLSNVDGAVAESGEARWTIEVAEENNIELASIKTAFQVRLNSQKGEINFGTKLLAATRNKFGGHAINQDNKTLKQI